MQFHAIGCYSAVSAIKALNRRAEARLAQAEAASALATWLAAVPYPYEKLRHLWETLLFNHFHDILCGTSIPSAMRDATEGLGGVIQGAEEVLNAGLRRLAATVAPGPDPADASFLVFNLTGAEQDGPIEHEPWLDKSLDEQPRRLLDDAGVEVPYQVLPAEGFLKGLHRILFAPRVPPFGYRLYRFVARKPTVPMPSTLCATHDSLENVRWWLTVDPATGGIARLTDKRTGREVFAGTAHLAIVVDDPSDTWSHGLDRFGFEGHVFECAGVDVIEAGPLRTGLRVRTCADDSIVTSTYLLHDDPAT
jgi:alpha-mannosidase